VRDSHQAKASGAPALPFAQRVALAVDAGIRELLPAREPVVHEVTLSTTVIGTASLTGVGTITARGSIALPRMGIAAQGTVEDRRGWLAGMTDGQKVAVVLVWLIAYALPLIQAALSPEIQAVVSDSVATFGLALIITWRIRDNGK